MSVSSLKLLCKVLSDNRREATNDFCYSNTPLALLYLSIFDNFFLNSKTQSNLPI